MSKDRSHQPRLGRAYDEGLSNAWTPQKSTVQSPAFADNRTDIMYEQHADIRPVDGFMSGRSCSTSPDRGHAVSCVEVPLGWSSFVFLPIPFHCGRLAMMISMASPRKPAEFVLTRSVQAVIRIPDPKPTLGSCQAVLNWREDLIEDPEFNTTYSLSQLLSIRKIRSQAQSSMYTSPQTHLHTDFLLSPRSVVQFKKQHTQICQTPTHYTYGWPKVICNDFVSRDCIYQDTLLP